MTLPQAVASGASATSPEAVKPLPVGIGAGVLAALYLFVVYLNATVPDNIIALVGGASDELGRKGGLAMTWLPPAGADTATIERRFAEREQGARLRRNGNAFVIEVPGVGRDDVDEVARRIASGGVLRFHEVLQVREMAELKNVLQLPMTGARPLDLEIDQWRPDDGGETQTDYYLLGDSREVIETALGVAAERGWKLPADAQIAYEHIEPSAEMAGGWRTYVIASRAELDGDSIASATANYDPYTNRPIVLLDFTREGGAIFGALTTRISGRKLATVVDGLVKSAPIINGPIRGGRASITMGGADARVQERERDMLVATLRGPALPPGGQLVASRFLEPGDTAAKVWAARLVIAIGGGVLVGLLAWGILRATRPIRRRAPARAPGPLPWVRLGVTLLGPVAVIGLSYVPILGVDYGALGERFGGEISTAYFNIGVLGITPIVTAFLLVELAAQVIPGWRRRRHAGARARRPFEHAVIALSFALVMLQSWGIASYIDALGRFDLEPLDEGKRALVAGSLAGGTLVFAVSAHLIRRHGLGNGFGALTVGSWLFVAVWPWIKQGPDREHLVEIVTLAAIIIPLAIALRWRVSAVGQASLRIPTSGIAPIGDGAGVVVLIGLLATLPFAGVTATLTDVSFAITEHRSVFFGLVVAMTLVWSLAFARPRVVTALARGAHLETPSRGTFWRGVGLSSAVLLFVLGPASLTYMVGTGRFLSLTDPIAVGLAVAVSLDIYDDLRARRGPLVLVWSLQQAQHADVVVHHLAAAGIPHHLAASNLRTLLAFFGPFAPIDVLVPPEHADAAHEHIATLYGHAPSAG